MNHFLTPGIFGIFCLEMQRNQSQSWLVFSTFHLESHASCRLEKISASSSRFFFSVTLCYHVSYCHIAHLHRIKKKTSGKRMGSYMSLPSKLRPTNFGHLFLLQTRHFICISQSSSSHNNRIKTRLSLKNTFLRKHTIPKVRILSKRLTQMKK